MGKNEADFAVYIHRVVSQYYQDFKTTQKHSKSGQYLSLSITVHAKSQVQLDALYSALSSDPRVAMVL